VKSQGSKVAGLSLVSPGLVLVLCFRTLVYNGPAIKCVYVAERTQVGAREPDAGIVVSGNYKCEISVNSNASVSASLITDFQRIKLKNVIFKDSFSVFQPV